MASPWLSVTVTVTGPSSSKVKSSGRVTETAPSLSTVISASSTGFPSWSATSTLTVLDLSSSPVSVPMISPAEPEALGTVI